MSSVVQPREHHITSTFIDGNTGWFHVYLTSTVAAFGGYPNSGPP